MWVIVFLSNHYSWGMRFPLESGRVPSVLYRITELLSNYSYLVYFLPLPFLEKGRE